MSALNLTAQRLHELLHYEPETGQFTWIVSRGNQFSKPGMKAGFKDTYGHFGIEIDGKRYLSHRLAWLYVYGKWPEHQIDHINRIRDDNRIENLRDVKGVVNASNKGNYCNNTTGFKGVTIKNGRFVAQITIDGKCKYIGSFDTAEKASDAYQQAKKSPGEREQTGASQPQEEGRDEDSRSRE
jgi:hypothetical protein